jgi:Amt family ammonium transporter
MKSNARRATIASMLATAATLAGSTAALAQAPGKIDPADTAWMMAATGLVLMMSIPGLALFYCGMVRKKNVLATMAQTLVCVLVGSLLWAVFCYSLTFSGDGWFVGTLDRFLLRNIGMETTSPLAKTIPEILFAAYQMTFAVITVALVAGSIVDRIRFSAFVWFAALWLVVVYVPIAHWVWGNGWLMNAGILDFAGGTVVHLNAGVAGLVAALVVGKRYGYGTDNLAPFDLSLAVIGTGLLWVGWFGFNGGSALGAGSRAAFAIFATHLAASAGALTWMLLEWWTRGKPSVLGVISGAVAGLGTITPASGFVLPWHGIVIGIDRRGRAGGPRRSARGQRPAGPHPTLRDRGDHRVVGRRDVRPSQTRRAAGAATGHEGERNRRPRRDPARGGVAVGGRRHLGESGSNSPPLNRADRYSARLGIAVNTVRAPARRSRSAWSGPQ